ncbi:MAG: hypothetical protein CMH79_00535 [Nitrospinae bacterium]|nr:hypothetical protein [Nitrospinota bacterium]
MVLINFFISYSIILYIKFVNWKFADSFVNIFSFVLTLQESLKMENKIYEQSEKLILAQKYQKQKTFLTVVSSLFLFFYTFLFVLFFLKQDENVFELGPFFSGVCYFAIYFVLRTFLSLPFEIKQSFKLPRKIGLSNETFFLWITNQIKSFLLVLFFGSLASGVLLVCIQKNPDYWWLYFSILISCIFIFIFLFGQTVIAPLFFNFEKLSDTKIENLLLNLKKKVGFKGQNHIWVMKTKKHGDYANAFVCGFGPTRKIVITENILEYNPEEIECIVAHELAHQFYSHNLFLCIYKIISFAVVIYFFKFLLSTELFYFYSNGLNISSANTIGIFLVFFSVLNFFISPILLRVSREIEFACDLFAFKHVTKPKNLITILKKLCVRNYCDPSPSLFSKFFFYTHPPFSERINRLISFLN